MKRQDRTGHYSLEFRQPRRCRPDVSSGPYHHVPRTAARDFTRTTGPKAEKKEADASMFQSQSTINARLKSEKPRPSADCGKKIPSGTTTTTLPPIHDDCLASDQDLPKKQGTAVLQHGKDLEHARLRKPRLRQRARRNSENVYHSLLQGHELRRRLSTGDMDQHLLNVESEPQPGSHALAHRITKQHLDDRVDWTQSDAQDNESKHLEWLSPLIRPVARKGEIAPVSDIEELMSADNELHMRKVSRRRSSFLSRYFAKKIPE